VPILTRSTIPMVFVDNAIIRGISRIEKIRFWAKTGIMMR